MNKTKLEVKDLEGEWKGKGKRVTISASYPLKYKEVDITRGHIPSLETWFTDFSDGQGNACPPFWPLLFFSEKEAIKFAKATLNSPNNRLGTYSTIEEQETDWKTYHDYWKTYRNRKYGWSIEYPFHWQADDRIPEFVRFISKEEEKAFGESKFKFAISVDILPSPMNTEEFSSLVEPNNITKLIREELLKQELQLSKISEQKVEIGDESAWETVSSLEPGKYSFKQRTIVLTKYCFGYVIVASCSPEKYDSMNQFFFDPMLQNFKFKK